MTSAPLTDADLLLLGLVAEMPRHGYELEQVIEERGMREWTRIGFSSIYFVLGRLEERKLVSTGSARGRGATARKSYRVTAAGRRALVAGTLDALRTPRPTASSALLGMINWSALEREEALAALAARSVALDAELARLEAIRAERQPLPDFVEALFDHATGLLEAEAAWVTRTLEYMRTKPWLT